MATEAWWNDIKQLTKQHSPTDLNTEVETDMESRDLGDTSHDIIISMDLLRELSLVGPNPEPCSDNNRANEDYTQRLDISRNGVDGPGQRIIYTTPESDLLSSPLAYFSFPRKTLSNLYPGERGPLMARHFEDSPRSTGDMHTKHRNPIYRLTLPDQIPNLDQFQNMNGETYNMYRKKASDRRDSLLASRYKRIKYGIRLQGNRVERADPVDVSLLKPTVVKLHHRPTVERTQTKRTIGVSSPFKGAAGSDTAEKDTVVDPQPFSPSSKFTVSWVNAGDDRMKFSYSLREKSAVPRNSPACLNSTVMDFTDARNAIVSPKNIHLATTKKKL